MAQKVRQASLSAPEAAARKQFAARLSIAVNVLLIATEGTIAALTGSLAVLADAGHSVFDLTASFFALWGVRMAAQPPDRAHPYGHEKFENFSSLIQVAMIGLIAVFIVGEGGRRLATGTSVDVSSVAIAVIAATMVLDFLVARYIGSVAQTYGSYALEADAFHFTTDLWAKTAVIAGLVGARFGSDLIDPAAALGVAAVMAYTASRLGLRSTHVLLDAAPRPVVEERVRAILNEEAGSDGYHSLRMRQAGKGVFLDVALHLPGGTTVAEAHDRAHRLSQRLCEEIAEVRDVVIHVEPAEHPEEHHDQHFQIG
ncbi:MAG: cation transporter [Chloroflexi bacterium]|nr:cation transporter [Chloroflexota bacterium]